METDDTPAFTVVLEITGPFGPEIQVLREKGEDAREAARRALHRWHDEDYVPTTTVEELEDGSTHVLAVLEGESKALLTRKSSRGLIRRNG
jgi:hypothetical protein